MKICTVAIFHCASGVGSAWNCAEGIVDSFSSLGYQTIDCGDPRYTNIDLDSIRHADLIILSAFEWYKNVIIERYGQSWFEFQIPKVAWYAESVHRDDQDFPFGQCKPLADLHYFPAIQDAEEFNGHWLPFGVDTEVFKPYVVESKIPVAFLGTMYPKRQEFCQNINYPIAHIGSVFGSTPLESALSLAKAYCIPNIFVNLPSYSRLLVTKVTEVMGCGTMLITPAVDHYSGIQNMKQFENGKHLVYYDPNNPKELGEIINYYSNNLDERDRIAKLGFDEVTSRHTIRHRATQIIEDVISLTHTISL